MAVELKDPVARATFDGGVAGAGEVVFPGEFIDIPALVGMLLGAATDNLFSCVGGFVVDADDELVGDFDDRVDSPFDGQGFVLNDQEG